MRTVQKMEPRTLQFAMIVLAIMAVCTFAAFITRHNDPLSRIINHNAKIDNGNDGGAIYRPSLVQNNENSFPQRAPHELTAHLDEQSKIRYFDFDQGGCITRFSLLSLMRDWLTLSVEWNIVGRDAPYYGLGFGMTKCLHPERHGGNNDLKECSNDPKQIPPRVAESFLKNGPEFYLKRIDKDLGGWLSSKRRSRALEFGCGLGRLALGWMTRFDAVDCVDQSVYHQELATRPLLQRFGKELVQKDKRIVLGDVNLLVTSPDLIRTADGHRYNFIHSAKVFQHILPMAQQVYWEQMCDLLAVGGRAWIHYQDGFTAFREKRVKNGQLSKRRPVGTPCDTPLCNVGISPNATSWGRHGVMSTYDFDTIRLRHLLTSRGCAIESIE